MARNDIQADHLEEAERALSRTYQLISGSGMDSVERVLARARIDRTAYDNFAKHHKERLFKQYLPDIDPRNEPAIMTMLLHFMAVGAVAQRLADGRPS